MFVQVADLERQDLAEVLCQTTELPRESPTKPRHILLRKERQTFRRLPKTRAIAFAVKTSMRDLTELSDAELDAFRKEMDSWPDDIAEYKGRNYWGNCAKAYCAARLGNA